VQHSKPKQFAYLVQCRKHWDYLFSLQSDNSDLYVLTFKQPLRYPNGITSIYYPESSWNTGRNKLYEVASQKEYKYFIFLDDDIIASHTELKTINPFRYLEAMLLKYKPAGAVGNFDWHFGNERIFKEEIQTIYMNDACLYAMHREVAKKVLPYWTKWDTISWWRSQYVLCQLMHTHFPQSTIQFNKLWVKNILHDEYPRDINNYLMCDEELAEILTAEQMAIYKPYAEILYQNDGEFIPLEFYLQTGE
jgi:hypothetical protein